MPITSEHSRPRVTDRLVISLAGSNRLKEFQRQPQAHDFEVFEAFDGRSGKGGDFFAFDQFVNRVGISPKGGEVGCSISHYLAIKTFASAAGGGQDVLIVAEDDVVFAPGFEPVVGNILHRFPRFDYVNMAEPYAGSKSVSILAKAALPMSMMAVPVGARNPFSHRVGSVKGRQWGTSLYMVTRSAARSYVEFVRSVERISWVADEYNYWAPRAGIEVSLVRPNLVEGWLGESSIDPDRGHGADRAPFPDTLRSRLSQKLAIRTRLKHTAGVLAATYVDFSPAKEDLSQER